MNEALRCTMLTSLILPVMIYFFIAMNMIMARVLIEWKKTMMRQAYKVTLKWEWNLKGGVNWKWMKRAKRGSQTERMRRRRMLQEFCLHTRRD